MLLRIDGLLSPEELARIRAIAREAPFVDGAVSAPGLAASNVKRNEQLATDAAAYKEFAQIVLSALHRNETLRTAALPKIVIPPILARYRTGMGYGTHIDHPIRQYPVPMRLDLSITVFLSAPEDYGGGDLLIETPYGEKSIKLPAGDAIVYPTTMLHRVSDVTAGERLAAVTWIQSMVQDQTRRTMLYDLAVLTQWALSIAPDSDRPHQLNNLRANLVRMWATD
jgi:PKHD-type hydroxylase